MPVNARIHLNALRDKYGLCAEYIAKKMGKNRQADTWEFEDFCGPAFDAAAKECESRIESVKAEMERRKHRISLRLAVCQQPCPEFEGMRDEHTVKCAMVTSACGCRSLATGNCPKWPQ